MSSSKLEETEIPKEQNWQIETKRRIYEIRCEYRKPNVYTN